MLQYSTADHGYASNGGHDVISTAIEPTDSCSPSYKEGARINFSVFDYPLSGSSHQNYFLCQTKTWQPPGIAGGDSDDPYWLAAWTNSRDKWDDSCWIKVFKSSSSFDDGTTTKLTNSCTQSQPALAYSPTDNESVLAYTKDDNGRDSGGNISQPKGNGRVYVRRSSDGQSWDAPKDAGFKALGGVDTTCDSDGTCRLSYMDADSLNPSVVTRPFTLTSTSGGFNIGTENVDDDLTHSTPRVESSLETITTDDLTFVNSENSILPSNRASGFGKVRTEQQKGNSLSTPFTWVNDPNYAIMYPGDIAGGIAYVKTPYLFTQQ